MAALTTAQELAQLQAAIQNLQNGAAQWTSGGVTFQYANMHQYLNREAVLLRRLSKRNVRKRTHPNFE